MGLKDQRFSILICADNNADTNTLYITEEFLVAQENNINAVSKVIIEELEHFLEQQFNTKDAMGDNY
ncbi:MAG: hypothetical protein QNJ65_13990 [Xenococcaceae cyanobacterium MO_234.B1]|nr:hypothetical protein [Xenococcaceae cyanobacterium MO_234.B1]